LLAAIFLFAGAIEVRAGISGQPWGVTADDARPAQLYTLTKAQETEVRTNYGGVAVSGKVPDRQGALADVVQGFDGLSRAAP
jgi:aldose 1-epimerase